jgi:hypothetical protein
MTPDEVDDHERETLSGRTLAWVEALRRADTEHIAQLEREIEALRRSEAEFARRLSVVFAYVRAFRAIREASYPSQRFTQACTRASNAHHELMAAFDP